MTTNEPSDADLLRLIAAGDEAALRVLFDRHAAWLVLRLRRRSPDEELVQEALQDTFLAAWRFSSRFRGEGDVGAWLWGIAVRQLINGIRRRRTALPLISGLRAEVTRAKQVPDAPSAEDELLLAVEHGDVGTAMQKLSPELRSALQATVLDGLTTREAAQLLGVPTGTVKSRVHLAKARLRSYLREGWA